MRDFHIHPNYSIDAQFTVEDYVKRAIELGLSAICFTTHIDLNPSREILDQWMRVDGEFTRLSDHTVGRYRDDIMAARKTYGDKLFIGFGFEFSYGLSFEQSVIDFIDRFQPDFTIGSLHCLENAGFTSGIESYAHLTTYTPEEFLTKYFAELKHLIKSGIFDSIGHIDGYKKYAPRYWNMDDMRKFEELHYPCIFSLMKQHDIGFELNTSALRKGHDDFYPRRKILEIARDYGAWVSSVGSDSHHIDYLGNWLMDAYAMIDKVGIELREKSISELMRLPS